ncbi:MAG TPA: RNA helicase [Flavobacteriales bacterium]|nr:DEAD/DEAH box helicase [Flavobacteriales bacterium]HAW21080.1 RNA helicase [Flavobacteriales bacterium]
MSFSSLRLSKHLQKTLAENQYLKPYPIQEQAIPIIRDGKDLLAIAQTGSGKTAAFVLPVLMNLFEADVSINRHIEVLVLVPTRELAVQVNQVFNLFSKTLPGRQQSMAVFGGVSINPQMINLRGVSILVATPGRLIELHESKAIHLDSVKTLILDEADKMLNMGFQKEVDQILALLPAKRQNLLFSATLNEEITKVRDLILNDPIVVKIEPKEDNIDLITQTAYHVLPEKKGPLLRHLIKSQDMKQVLVFVSSTVSADKLEEKLVKNGIEAKATHSKKSHMSRVSALRDFKAGHLPVLIATDLISRGIDIEFLPFVVNYELPRSPKDYIHRIGRTGRAESSGEAISMITPDDLHHFKVIQKKMKKWVKLTYSEDMEF